MITVILNGYRRQYLNEQLAALEAQTIKPDEILLWYNYPGDDIEMNADVGSKIPAAYCNYNFGVWARFAFALNAKNPYVCIFDDDTIPGKKWLENCINTMKTHEGLLGTVGLQYIDPLPADKSSYYEPYIRYGWPVGGNNEETKQVDLVGHSWFFKKVWLSYFWRELPNAKYNNCGEDMHFSHMLQKYANINTFVPPHPISDKEMWGSIKGAEYGGDSDSLWENNTPNQNGVPFKYAMNEYFHKQREAGWKFVNDSTRTFDGDILNILDKLTKRIPFSFSKYADGEFAILVNRQITNCDGWVFNPSTDAKYRDELLSSFKFNEPGYYVGISCPCCVPPEDVVWMRMNVGVKDQYLTWANLFVNSNYKIFTSLFIPEFKNHDIILVANKNATINKLPFDIERFIPIENTAWKENFDLLDTIPFEEYSGKVFLFCAGPLGNMLAAKMWKHNKKNIYMDIGSTLNPWLVGNNRDYLLGNSDLNKQCIW